MTKNIHWGSSVDDWLKEEGVYQEVTAAATKAVLARQLAEEMKRQGISKTKMAQMMQTSRAQLERLLDPKNNSATLALATVQRAAKIVGRELRVELV
jgi:hypothetical protein